MLPTALFKIETSLETKSISKRQTVQHEKGPKLEQTLHERYKADL